MRYTQSYQGVCVRSLETALVVIIGSPTPEARYTKPGVFVFPAPAFTQGGTDTSRLLPGA
mgnify:CR=1 FL=1